MSYFIFIAKNCCYNNSKNYCLNNAFEIYVHILFVMNHAAKVQQKNEIRKKTQQKCKKMQKNLVMSEKSSNFAGYFAERPD